MRKLNAAIQFDGKWFVARCLDVPVTSQGETLEAAKANLKEAIELYIETWESKTSNTRLANLNSLRSKLEYESAAGRIRRRAG
jgi:predicted RNase H-like HicB family nuclease